MGKDKLYQKRKAKQASALARKKSYREQFKKVLIVCEGAKTEPTYFNDLKNHYKLSTTDVVIHGEKCGSAPISIFEFSVKKYEEAERNGDPFDNVFCVFDRDTSHL